MGLSLFSSPHQPNLQISGAVVRSPEVAQSRKMLRVRVQDCIYVFTVFANFPVSNCYWVASTVWRTLFRDSVELAWWEWPLVSSVWNPMGRCQKAGGFLYLPGRGDTMIMKVVLPEWGSSTACKTCWLLQISPKWEAWLHTLCPWRTVFLLFLIKLAF